MDESKNARQLMIDRLVVQYEIELQELTNQELLQHIKALKDIRAQWDELLPKFK